MPNSRHTVTDHAMGALAGHGHGEGEFDHDHDDDFLESGSRALESVSFVSMGLDVGSSSTQIVFTRLQMRGPGEHRALRRQTKSRETLYLSPIAVTPFLDDGSIDEVRLRGTIASAFRAAGLTPDDIETGAMILTGEAARRSNAAAIAHLVAEDVGELVCAAAGDHMEAMLAAHGSGAVEASREGAGRRILNVDIGGATTKLAVVDDGHVTATAALAIGGRLIVVDKANRITRCDAAGVRLAQRAGVVCSRGAILEPDARARLGATMADALLAALRTRPAPADIASLFVTDPVAEYGAIDGVMISGGVGEYVYGRESRDFGDLGRSLGQSLAARIAEGALPWPLLPAGECIRATAFGASEHSLQLSGQTIYISNHAALLPRRNLPVLQPPFDFALDFDGEALAAAIAAHRAAFGLAGEAAQFALALRWRGPPDYSRLRSLAVGIAAGLPDLIAWAAPLCIMIEGDAALSLGAILRDELKVASEVLVIDGIVLRDFDFVDIGRLRLPSFTVPVTIKSLLFGAGCAKSPNGSATSGLRLK